MAGRRHGATRADNGSRRRRTRTGEGAVRGHGLLAGWVAVLVATLVAFTALGEGALAAPELTAPSTWADWAAGRDTPTVVMALLRLLVLALAGYLLAATMVAVVARLSRSARLVRLADAVSLPVVRHVVHAGLGASVAASLAVATPAATLLTTGTPVAAAAAAAEGEERTDGPVSDAPTMTPLTPEPTAPEPTAPAPTTSPRILPPGMVPPGTVPEPDADAPPREDPDHDLPTAPDPRESDPPDPAPATAEHVVVSGDHLWSIAEGALTDHLGREPTDAEVVPYWQRVVAGNRDRLVDPDNPDLILPGQHILLPEVDG